jgi:hypothetical protein
MLVAYETDSSNHVRFLWYASEDALRAGTIGRTFDANRSLSSCAEGTPCIEKVTWNGSLAASTFDVSFHYFRNCDVDRQATGTLSNWTASGTASWSEVTAPDRDQPFADAGFAGNFGDWDVLDYNSVRYRLHEAQKTKGDWASWRPFLVSPDQTAELAVKTPNGSTSFGNPTFSLLTLNGMQVLFATMFVFAQGAGAGEAGCLAYYHYF